MVEVIGESVERGKCCGMSVVDVRRIFVEAINAVSLDKKEEINNKERLLREWLYFIGREVGYEF